MWSELAVWWFYLECDRWQSVPPLAQSEMLESSRFTESKLISKLNGHVSTVDLTVSVKLWPAELVAWCHAA